MILLALNKQKVRFITAAAILLLLTITPASAEPPLPPGLGDTSGDDAGAAPQLPSGLGLSGSSTEKAPDLPIGLNGEQPEKEKAAEIQPAIKIHGFADVRAGMRTVTDDNEPDSSLAEARLQVEHEQPISDILFHGRLDILYDDVSKEHDIDLNEGSGWLDLREAWMLLRPASFLDLTAGRQILTWGTGDLLFLNDLFPKDWNSFFLGRDVEYLKAPSDALKASFFSSFANVDIVYTPQFDADRFIDGSVVSYYSSRSDAIVGRNSLVRTEERDEWLDDDEWAVRLHRTIKAYEFALYGYDGYWKSPAGSDPFTGKAIFPSLSVYGLSVRGPFAGGIGSAECSYYDSTSDQSGENAFIRNSEMRLLLGYDKEIMRNFTAGLQYYLEYMRDHDNYRNSLPAGSPEKDQDRHVLTLRLTRLLLNQNLTLSFFAFYSPTDQDTYLRPLISYKMDDHWTISAGGNFFFGEEDHTFFGQFKDNSNIYGALRFSF